MKSLKLNNLEKSSLNEKEMKHVTGGDSTICYCGCLYANQGGSSTVDNGCANSVHGRETPDCPRDRLVAFMREIEPIP